MIMLKPELIFLLLSLLILGPQSRFCRAEFGPASYYAPPYTPTACYDSDPGQFPPNSYFAAASEGMWDNGAACGRQYVVNCISSTVSQACRVNVAIVVRIVDRASTSVSRPVVNVPGLVLSGTAYSAIASIGASTINIQYIQLA